MCKPYPLSLLSSAVVLGHPAVLGGDYCAQVALRGDVAGTFVPANENVSQRVGMGSAVSLTERRFIAEPRNA